MKILICLLNELVGRECWQNVLAGYSEYEPENQGGVNMPSRGEIKSEKILVKDIFSRMWFRVPEYQRPYVWGREEISDLLDDLTFAMTEKPDFEYFLGSLVFQSKPAAPDSGQEFDENDLLQFLLNKVLIIYVSTEDLEDAFRLFMILNDRGIPLRNSDILKSMNLGALEQ